MLHLLHRCDTDITFEARSHFESTYLDETLIDEVHFSLVKKFLSHQSNVTCTEAVFQVECPVQFSTF